jgi:hypothetical protein
VSDLPLVFLAERLELSTAAGTDVALAAMYPDVREMIAGKCPKCGMDLTPEGTRFALFRHMIGRRSHLVIMAALMVAAMTAAMMMMR